MDPEITDRGSHLEVLIGAPRLRGLDAVDILVRASVLFGAKPLLVICDDPHATVSLEDAYRIGVHMSTRLPLQRIAIVLRGRQASEADHFTELVAANRGVELRYFDEVAPARAWLVR